MLDGAESQGILNRFNARKDMRFRLAPCVLVDARGNVLALNNGIARCCLRCLRERNDQDVRVLRRVTEIDIVPALNPDAGNSV